LVLNLQKNNLEGILSGGFMSRKPLEILHTLMTNQFCIFALAILLFLLAVTLAGPGKSEAVISELWI
jgi:hypothetical protein